MADSLLVKKDIPAQIANEGATYGPLNLKEFFQSTTDGVIHFSAELDDGSSLPAGLICTTDGIINGIAAKNTQGHYRVVITAEDDFGGLLKMEYDFAIKSRISMEGNDLFNKLKAEVWEALGKNLPLPDMQALLDRPITAVEIYYLLQRFATLTIWDVYNLESPSEKHILTLPGANKHYEIYDRGSCLVGAPKDLFSHERTLEDALQTARVMAQEAYKRNWVIEFAGFNKMVRAAWIELQHIGDEKGKHLEVLHFSPSLEDVKLYTAESKARVNRA